MLPRIGIQKEYIKILNGEHFGGVSRRARHTAEKKLKKLGYTPEQIESILQDARDMAVLIQCGALLPQLTARVLQNIFSRHNHDNHVKET